MTKIFVSGPYSHGDVFANVQRAERVGADLIALGFSPFIPHLYHYLPGNNPNNYETMMAVDQAWLQDAHGLLRIPGYSPGADREVTFAQEHGIPVFQTVEEVCRYFGEAE